jgi:hypothetical protein
LRRVEEAWNGPVMIAVVLVEDKSKPY